MRLKTNTIGNIENPTEEDIRKAFLDKETEDLIGNVYNLYHEDGNSIHSISSHSLRNFSLSLGDKTNAIRICNEPLTRDQVVEYFIQFFHGNQTWVSHLTWREEKISQKPKIILAIFALLLYIILQAMLLVRIFST